MEQERPTRRQALRKFGFGAGLSAFMLLGVDDLARMVGKEMERRAGDSKVAGQIAKEFQSAGVALAGGPSGLNCDGSYGMGGACDDNCTPGIYQYCAPCAYPCTGSVLRDKSCGSLSTQADCVACCNSRNNDYLGTQNCQIAGRCGSLPGDSGGH